MLVIAQGVASIEGIEDLRGTIEVSGGDARAIGRPFDGEIAVLVTMGIDGFAVSGMPDLDGAVAIITTGGDVGAIGRPCHAADKTGMTAIGENVGAS